MALFGKWGNPNLFFWPNQIGTTQYEVASASKADFSEGCATHWIQQYDLHFLTGGVLPGRTRFYLVRPILPNVGSWGADSRGTERSVPCAP